MRRLCGAEVSVQWLPGKAPPIRTPVKRMLLSVGRPTKAVRAKPAVITSCASGDRRLADPTAMRAPTGTMLDRLGEGRPGQAPRMGQRRHRDGDRVNIEGITDLDQRA